MASTVPIVYKSKMVWSVRYSCAWYVLKSCKISKGKVGSGTLPLGSRYQGASEMYWGMCGLISFPSSSTAAGTVPSFLWKQINCHKRCEFPREKNPVKNYHYWITRSRYWNWPSLVDHTFSDNPGPSIATGDSGSGLETDLNLDPKFLWRKLSGYAPLQKNAALKVITERLFEEPNLIQRENYPVLLGRQY